MAKRVLITGVGGFIGSLALEYWYEKTDWIFLGLDSFKHKGYVTRIEDVKKRLENPPDWNKRVKLFTHDLTVPIDPPLENLLMDRSIDDMGVINENKIDVIINFASDSAVERSITDPLHCWHNNCNLISTVLEFARKVKPSLTVHISTDETMGEAPPLPSLGHKEWATIMPSNNYAASKAAQEALCISYFRSYDLPVVITNCANVLGESQDPEKFLPKIIQFIAQGKTDIPIYADEVKNWGDYPWNHIENNKHWYIGSRIYLDARNKADALLFLVNRKPARYSEGAKQPDRYNICGPTEFNNLELAQKVAQIMGKELKYKLVSSESARPGYDRRYALDGSKLASLGWLPPIPLDDTLKRIVNWTIQSQHWLL